MRICLVLTAAFMVAAASGSASAQSSPKPSTDHKTKPVRPTGATGTPRASATNDNASITQLQVEVEGLRSDLDLYRTLLLIFLGGGVTLGIVTTFRTDRRSTELHHLAIAGESASQGRNEQVHTSFLDSSQKTLTLVNETLELAKEASQRAAEALELRAERVRDRIEIRAREIVGPLVGKSDLKEIVTDPDARLDIADLAKEIASVQGYLEMQSMDLSSTCRFVMGMDAHFAEDTRVAVRNLTRAAEEATNRDLTTASLYWAGYELNNSGKYGRAGDIFRKARSGEKAGTPRYYELQRLILETMFFDLSHKNRRMQPHERSESKDLRDLVEDIARVHQGIPDHSVELGASRARLIQTEGNVWTWMAAPPWFPHKERGLSEGRRECLEKAQRLYHEIVELRHDDLWPLFGYAESSHHLGSTIDTRNLSTGKAYEKIIELAVRQLTQRVERRSRVSLDQTRLIAQFRLGVGRTELAHTYERLRENLNLLDRDMYVFSQAQKSNVPWVDFEEEIDRFWKETEIVE